MLATILIACALNSPSAEVTIKHAGYTEHGTILAPCPLTKSANYERLIKLMAKPVDSSITEIPPLPRAK